MLMATCCEDDIIKEVLPFVKDNISNPDWRFRDAAVMAFGEFYQYNTGIYAGNVCVPFRLWILSGYGSHYISLNKSSHMV